MSSLDLKMVVPTSDIMHKVFKILRVFLQPNTVVTQQSAANSILDLLPDKAPESTEVWEFGELCIELAEQIPYHHPSQLKLVGLLHYLGMSTKFGSMQTYKEMKSSQFHRYQRLGESLRDALADPDPDCLSHYVNFQAFAANLYEYRIFFDGCTWAIWAQRDAHEECRDEPASVRDAWISGAAQWIFWYGQSFFKHVLFPGEISIDDLGAWRPGPLYTGKGVLSLERWHFWRDGFKAAASEEKEEGKGYTRECKLVAAKAADMMDSVERNMTF